MAWSLGRLVAGDDQIRFDLQKNDVEDVEIADAVEEGNMQKEEINGEDEDAEKGNDRSSPYLKRQCKRRC